MEWFDLVDENDNVIGKVENLKDIPANTLRFINIIIINDKNEILVPKRSSNRRIFPNCYDFSVGGHVSSGETYEQAAYRELEEELGIKGEKLIEIGYFNPYIDEADTFSKLYLLRYNQKIENYDKDGIDKLFYITINEIKELLEKEPQNFKTEYSKMIKFIIKNKII